ncbi:hypothetical protein ACSVDA_21290 [Cytobacillus sp. Hm23]
MTWEKGEWLDYHERQHKIEEINDIITLIDAEYTSAEESNNAFASYETNREEMDEGADVLWADVHPLYKLMK